MNDEQRPTRAARLIVVGFALLLASAWLVPGDAANENRALTAFPAVTAEGLESATFFRSVDAALVDRMGLKGDVVSAVGGTLLAANISNSDQVFLGPGGETFLTDDFVLACRQRTEIAAMEVRLDAVRDELAAHGIDFLYAVAPDRTSIDRAQIGPLADRLMRCADASRVDLQTMADRPGSPLFVAWDEISGIAGERYIPGDTHWNGKVSTVFAQLLLDRLAEDGVARPGIFDSSDLHPRGTTAYVGGLYGLMGVDRSATVTVFGTVRDGVETDYDEEEHDGVVTQHWTSTGPDLIEGRTLILQDSFFDLHAAVLAPYFADLTAVPMDSITNPGALAQLDGYDHVIVEQVQRSVPNNLLEIPKAGWITSGR